jgi:DNA-binding NtrC family response regulator
MPIPNSMTSNILVVDDDAGQRSLLQVFLTRLGHEVHCACDGEEAKVYLEKGSYDLIFSDVQMPKCDGLALLSYIIENNISTPVILITGYADVKQAVQAISSGALTYLEKPIDLDELLALMKKTLTSSELTLQDMTTPDLPYLPQAVIEAPVMKDLYQEASLVAPSMARVLLTGESGCGKEVLAEHLHHWSSRADKPLVKINCAAIPENLLESELFGHEKGAFTGAHSAREGCFQRADSGTLFLDEIGEMSLPCQAKLLRVLQDGLITRVGGSQTIKVDVRVLSATNRQLEDEIRCSSLLSKSAKRTFCLWQDFSVANSLKKAFAGPKVLSKFF